MESLRSSGRLFQRRGPQWLKADAPWVFVEALGTTRRPAAEDLRDLLGTHLKSMSGSRPFSDLKTSHKFLQSILKLIGNDFKIGVICALSGLGCVLNKLKTENSTNLSSLLQFDLPLVSVLASLLECHSY